MLAGSGGDQPTDNQVAGSNVTTENGKQIITIAAKGGYAPRKTTAQAGIPGTLRIATNNTFDCSSSIVIPSLNYRKYLPPTGNTDLEIPAQARGTKLQGLCGMGMYSFEIAFN